MVLHRTRGRRVDPGRERGRDATLRAWRPLALKQYLANPASHVIDTPSKREALEVFHKSGYAVSLASGERSALGAPFTIHVTQELYSDLRSVPSVPSRYAVAAGPLRRLSRGRRSPTEVEHNVAGRNKKWLNKYSHTESSGVARAVQQHATECVTHRR
jgi:hypothetical protein